MKTLLLLLLSLSLFAMSQNKNRIDDWDYNATKPVRDGGMIKSMSMPSPVAMSAAPMLMRKNLGFSVGGAKDANNFYENLKKGYLPKIDSITYEGVFYDHRFEMPKQECKELFCPNFETAARKNLFTDKKEYFLSVGLDSNIDADSFKRKKLNLVVVLDISGSMRSPFDRYYYDRKRYSHKTQNEDSKKSKMQIANESIVSMIDHLKGYDSLGVVLFDHQAYLAKPLRKVSKTDMKAIKKHILELKPRGGTNWSEGYKKGLELFKDKESSPQIENRIIFITDAMPNNGELRKKGLFGMIKDASKRGIYTTVIGVGVDFNNDLVEYVTKTKGANYLSVHSSKEFKKRLDSEFDYLVTPLVYDLKLQMLSNSYKIKRVYATATNQKESNTLIRINTLFPSSNSNEGVKGGVILVLLDKISSRDIKLKVSYHDRDGNYHESIKKVKFKNGYYYGGSAIRKAIILSDYVNIIKNWLVDTRKACHDKVSTPPPFSILIKRSVYPPVLPLNIKTWERRSCKLKVSDGYKKLFSIFLREFQKQKYLLRDNSLKKEENTLKLLFKRVDTTPKKSKKDDWIIKN